MCFSPLLLFCIAKTACESVAVDDVGNRRENIDLRVNVSSCCCSLSFLSSVTTFIDGRIPSKRKKKKNPQHWLIKSCDGSSGKNGRIQTPFHCMKIDNKPTIPPLDCHEFLVSVLKSTVIYLTFGHPNKELISACLLEAFLAPSWCGEGQKGFQKPTTSSPLQQHQMICRSVDSAKRETAKRLSRWSGGSHLRGNRPACTSGVRRQSRASV